MISKIDSSYSMVIKSYINSSDKLSAETNLQALTRITEKIPQYDTLELSQSEGTLNIADEISVEVPRSWTIMTETFECWNRHLQSSLDRASGMNLSFGDRLAFLKEDSKNWVENMQQNDPEMFAEWLKINKYSIEQGEADLVGLPADFTIQDYYSYVKEPFSVLA